MNKVKASNFVKRQTKESKFGYFDGSWSKLEKLVEEHLSEAKEGYRDGVVLIPVPVHNFYSSIVQLKETDEFVAEYTRRVSNEDPQLSTSVLNRGKQPAKYVDIVLYRYDVLEEDNDRSQDSYWEIISINASLHKNTPMHPITMMRNELHLAGGTQASYSKEEYIEAIRFWSSHANTY